MTYQLIIKLTKFELYRILRETKKLMNIVKKKIIFLNAEYIVEASKYNPKILFYLCK